MPTYYRSTVIALALVLVGALVASVMANSAASSARLRGEGARQELAVESSRAATVRAKLERLRAAMQPVRQFAVAWHPAVQLAERDAAERIRTEMEAVAQRQLGLVTDSAITPQPEKVSLHGHSWRVQRVTLRGSGKDIGALLAWLGKVEERYPAAILESCEFVSNVGGSTGLTLRLMQPLADAERKRSTIPAPVDPTALSEALAVVPWTRYMPGRLKAPVGVGFQRNPLQPAVPAETQPLLRLAATGDEYGPKVEALLQGRIRSVIRGAAPLIVFDGRIFRIGDELTNGRSRGELLADCRIRLKQISEHTLTFHVTGSAGERPVSCDVSYLLPAFLRAR